MSFQGSFKSGVVSASPCQEIIDSTDFFGILQDTAVTHKKYRNHVYFSSYNALICRVLARFARFAFSLEIVKM